MPAFLTFDSIAAATPDGRPLFESLTLAVQAERVGVVGRNGCGKSTLLRIAAGEAAPAAGSVARSGSVGMLRQDWPDGLSVGEVLGVTAMLARLARLAAGEGDADDLAAADWTLEARLDAALGEVGLDGLAFDRRIATLSGGERTRVGIARLLVERPDLLLLDEPTNNLDAAGRAAIAALFDGWRGGVLVASHDRQLLDRVDRIVELTPRGVHVFGGGWSAFAAARDAARARAMAERDRAAEAVRLARVGAHSPHETRSRLALVGAGLPEPLLQAAVFVGSRLVAVLDWLWDDEGVFGEADGKTKVLEPWHGRTPGEAVWREKRRHDELVDLDLRGVRLAPADLFEALPGKVDRVRRLLATPPPGPRRYRVEQRNGGLRITPRIAPRASSAA